MKVKAGLYKHFKGGIYEVLGTSKHTETGEELVLYKGADDQLWSRPIEMFLEVGNFIPELRDQRPRFTPLMAIVIKTKFGYLGTSENIHLGYGKTLSGGVVFTGEDQARTFDDTQDSWKIKDLLYKYKNIGAEVRLIHKKK